MTFISSATSVLHIGARPVFADIDPDTFDLDAADVARRITPNTKAILAVHYGGQPADLDGLRAVADGAGVLLLEDAAEAHGATYGGSPVGSFGRAAVFSFTPTKNVTTGEGGLVTTNDGDLARRLRLLRNHGQAAIDRYVMLGYNWRLTEMQAAMGKVQLTKLPAVLDRKRANAAKLTARLDEIDGVQPPVVRPGCDPAFMIYTVLVDRDRDRLASVLRKAGIESRVYFPPAHLQPVLADFRTELPVTESVAPRMLSVPMHAQLRAAELDAIADAIADGLTR
jgi:perosamine synthetase